MSSFLRIAALAAAIALPALAGASPPGAPGRPGVASSAPSVARGATASPKERGELTRQFVTKWGMYVQRVYGVPVRVWSKRMAPTFATIDADNFRRAVQRETFEGAMAELNGAGAQISDAQVIARLAASPSGGEKTLGALNNDLVYTPIAPCRILDTRSTVAGAIAANSTRSFLAINSGSFTSQGGSATDCGTLGLSATAVAINLTAVTPTIAGYATAYPYGTAQPLASSINYTAGAIVNNALIVQIPNPLSTFDFTLYTFGQAHYVADIVGYFAPPVATALQCLTTASTTVASIAPGDTADATAPACPAGYTQTSTNCESSSWLMPMVFISAGTCSARNNDSSPRDLRASRTCCRVPGR